MMTVEQLLTSSRDYSRRTKEVQSKYPFYQWCCQNVPGYKTKRGNLLFRKKVLKLALEKEDFALVCYPPPFFSKKCRRFILMLLEMANIVYIIAILCTMLKWLFDRPNTFRKLPLSTSL